MIYDLSSVKWILFVMLILGVGGFGWYFYRSVMAPTLNEEEMKRKAGFVEKVSDEKLTKISGVYVSFETIVPRYYQDGFGVGEKGSGFLEGYKFYGGSPKVMVVVLVEDRREKGKLTEIPSVLLRQNDVNKYTNYYDEKDGYKAVIFESNGEKSAFWIGKDVVYSLVVTGSDGGKVFEVFDGVWQSLRTIEAGQEGE